MPAHRSPRVLETCLTGFLASLAALNSDYRFKDYELCLGAVEKALARIAGKDLGSAPISFSSANYAEYIQAYFYPSSFLWGQEGTLRDSGSLRAGDRKPSMKRPCSVQNTHETTNPKNKGQDMGFFDFLSPNKGQSETGQNISDEDVRRYLSMAVTFSCAYSLEMFAATKRLDGNLSPEEEGFIDLGGYLMFVDAFASTDILTRVAGTQRVFSEDELDAVAKHTNCYTVCTGALEYAIAFLEPTKDMHGRSGRKIPEQGVAGILLQGIHELPGGFLCNNGCAQPAVQNSQLRSYLQGGRRRTQADIRREFPRRA